MSTEETENFHRVVSLLVDVGTSVLRQLFLSRAITAQCTSVTQFLLKEQLAISRLQKKKHINGYQVQMLYPGAGAVAEPGDWDISLICLLLKHCLKLSQSEQTEVDSVRKFRNALYGHTGSATLTAVEFNKYWTGVETSVRALAAACNDPTFNTRIHSLMTKIKVGPLDMGSSVAVLTGQLTADTVTTRRLIEMESRLETAGQAIKDAARPPDVPPYDPVFENLKRHTQTLLQEKLKQPYVTTRQYDNVREVLQTNNVVVIAGKPGEGKTLTALKLVRDKTTGIERVVYLSAPSQWDHIDVDEVDTVLLDDVLGRYHFDPAALLKWRHTLASMLTYVNDGKLQVIITARANVLAEAPTLPSDIAKLFSYVVHLSSDAITANEKTEILQELLQYHSKDIHEVNVHACCEKYQAPIGFPYSCFLFASNAHLYDMKEIFFSRPLHFFKEAIGCLDAKSRAALLFLFYKKGESNVKELKPKRGNESNEELLNYVSDVVGLPQGEMSLTSVREAFGTLSGTYITCINKIFAFTHNTIYECVALIHGEMYPEDVIENCTWNFLFGCIALRNKGNELQLTIETETYGCLCTRFISDILTSSDSSLFYTFRDCRFIQDEEFCVSFAEVLRSDRKTREFLTRQMQHDGWGFLTQILRENKDNGASFAQSVIFDLKCETTPCDIGQCWKCAVKNQALRGACWGGVRDIAKALIDLGAAVHPKCLLDACESRNIELTKDMIATLKLEGKFDGKDVYSAKSLYRAARVSDIDYETLKQEGLIPTTMCIFESVQDGDIPSAKKFIEEAKRLNIWGTTDMWIFYSVSVALSKNNIMLYNLFKDQGVPMRMAFLSYAVESGDLSLVHQVVSDLKTANKWNRSTSDMDPFQFASRIQRGEVAADLLLDRDDQSAAKALISAKQLDNNDIYDFLRSENVIFTMGTLKWAVKTGSLDFVEDVVDELKSNGKWDTTSKDAGSSLLVTKKDGNERMYSYLKEQRIEFTMSTLLEVIPQQSLDLAEFVIDELKKCKQWNPTHIAAPMALSMSFEQGDTSMFQFLTKSGIQVNMVSILTSVVSCDHEGVKKFISMAKLAGIWNPQDPLVVACLTMTEHVNPEMHAILVNEGAGISSATLLDCAKNNDLMVAIMTLKELKDHGQWHPDSDPNILKAFQLYCYRNNSLMYVALAKSGCKITMESLMMILSASTVMRRAVEGIQPLSILTASVIAENSCVYVSKANAVDCMGVCINAFKLPQVSSLPSVPLVPFKRVENSANFHRALEIACENCNPAMYKCLADTDVVVPKKYIDIVVDKVLANAQTKHVHREHESEPVKLDNEDEAACMACTKMSDKVLTRQEKVLAVMELKPKSLISFALQTVYCCVGDS